MTLPQNYTPPTYAFDHRHLLIVRRASLIQQAAALAEQRRAILAEVGEIDKALKTQDPDTEK